MNAFLAPFENKSFPKFRKEKLDFESAGLDHGRVSLVYGLPPVVLWSTGVTISEHLDAAKQLSL